MKQIKIFLVEDDNVLARTTEWRIHKLGYKFAGRAASGKDAIEFISQQRPDIVLMDISLRGAMDGVETADIITKSFDIPIIYLTADMDKETISRAKLTQPKGYLVKPFDDKDLMASIELAVRSP
jgi:CheY-like chemotaxis protein